MTREEIEAKYEGLIAETLERMKERTMAELWAALEALKAEMAAEAEKAGVDLA